MKAYVIMNEQYVILKQQRDILNATFSDWEFVKVPASGWTKGECKGVILHLTDRSNSPDDCIVFVSPVPLAIGYACKLEWNVGIFHNDQREAKEIPDGQGGTKVIHTVSPNGWKLVFV